MDLKIYTKIWVINSKKLTIYEDLLVHIGETHSRLHMFGQVSTKTLKQRLNTPIRKLGDTPASILLYSDEELANKVYLLLIKRAYKQKLLYCDKLKSDYLMCIDQATDLSARLKEHKEKVKSCNTDQI